MEILFPAEGERRSSKSRVDFGFNYLIYYPMAIKEDDDKEDDNEEDVDKEDD